ncbi:hypothetical protein EXIGLDRAFT_663754 [Exidia glandulosa HHB12029]|uniref:Casein kinase II subunit beta n=1 Tax=Exidia glandulosa HHB12029 TaxID=1314781 RepID=A0A166BUW4_EXIGL|nr:hypothetical protein EXIGLDRAFT_663754 [Exidia glandulosa HHB12029]
MSRAHNLPSSSRAAAAQMTTPVDDHDVPHEYDDRSSENSEQSSLTWIAWFCSIPGHEYFCEVAEEFIEDDFNLTGLNSMVPFWKEAMEMVLDVEPEDTLKIPDVSIVEQSAEVLYGLVHQRYILTRAGLQAMAEKYENGQFGACPRVYCQSCPVLPCGRTDVPGIETVKLYCPNCHDLYTPPSSRYQSVDGAFFGTTFPHLFFQTYRELAPASYYNPLDPPDQTFVNPNPHGGQKRASGDVYVPKIYGFRVSERAKSGPRMRWLRLRPTNPDELDQVDWRGRWIGSDDGYEEDEEDGDNAAPMEDFDPDAGEDDDEESEEEEEDDAPPVNEPMDHGGGRRRAVAAPGVVEPTAARDASPSASSSSAVHTPADTHVPSPISRPGAKMAYAQDVGALADATARFVRVGVA